MGKYKIGDQARFWSADYFEERLEIIRQACGSGNTTLSFHAEVAKKHLEFKLKKLELRTNAYPLSTTSTLRPVFKLTLKHCPIFKQRFQSNPSKAWVDYLV